MQVSKQSASEQVLLASSRLPSEMKGHLGFSLHGVPFLFFFEQNSDRHTCGQHLSLPVLCGFWHFLQFLRPPDINGNKFVIIFNKCLTTL